MSSIVLAPIGIVFILGSLAVLGIVYSALVISARTDAIVRTWNEQNNPACARAIDAPAARPSSDNRVFRPTGHTRHAAV
jgi:hypothetical protein